MLPLPRPLLLRCNLCPDEGFLTDFAQFDLNDLQRNAFSVVFIKLLIDRDPQFLSLSRAISPERIVVEVGYMPADCILNPGAVSAFVA